MQFTSHFLVRYNFIQFGQTDQYLTCGWYVFQPQLAVVPREVSSQVMLREQFIADDSQLFVSGSCCRVNEVGDDIRFTQQDGDWIHQDDLSNLVCILGMDQPRDAAGTEGMSNDRHLRVLSQVQMDGFPNPGCGLVFGWRWFKESLVDAERNSWILKEEQWPSVAAEEEEHWQVQRDSAGRNSVHEDERQFVVVVGLGGFVALARTPTIPVPDATARAMIRKPGASQDDPTDDVQHRKENVDEQRTVIRLQRVQAQSHGTEMGRRRPVLERHGMPRFQRLVDSFQLLHHPVFLLQLFVRQREERPGEEFVHVVLARLEGVRDSVAVAALVLRLGGCCCCCSCGNIPRLLEVGRSALLDEGLFRHMSWAVEPLANERLQLGQHRAVGVAVIVTVTAFRKRSDFKALEDAQEELAAVTAHSVIIRLPHLLIAGHQHIPEDHPEGDFERHVGGQQKGDRRGVVRVGAIVVGGCCDCEHVVSL